MPFGTFAPGYSALAQQNNGADLSKTLEDMATTLESAEWCLIFSALFSAISLSLTIVFTVLINVAWRVHWSWWWIRNFCGLFFAVSIVLIIEPRPAHWLPSLEAMSATMGRCSLSECKLRYRRWWRWRSKYAAKTKLNV